REVARPGVELPYQAAAVGERHGDDRAGREPPNLEPVPLRAVVAEQLERAADRVDRDVGVTVVVEVGDGEPAAVPRFRRSGVERADGPAVRGHDADPLRVLGKAPDGDSAVRDRELGAAVEIEVGPARAPTRVLLAERADEGRPRVRIGETGGARAVRRVELAA